MTSILYAEEVASGCTLRRKTIQSFYTKDKRCENIHNYQILAVVLLSDQAKVLEHSNLHHLIPGYGHPNECKVYRVRMHARTDACYSTVICYNNKNKRGQFHKVLHKSFHCTLVPFNIEILILLSFHRVLREKCLVPILRKAKQLLNGFFFFHTIFQTIL